MKRLLAMILLALPCAAFAQDYVMDPASFYDYEKGAPPCEVEIKESAGEYTHFSLSYQCSVKTDYPDNSVYLDFYEPKGREKYPVIIFLSHIAGGIPEIEGEFCRSLASGGIGVLLVQTAYQKNYSFGRKWLAENLKENGEDAIVQLFRQIVIEARRGIDWVETRPRADRQKIGAMGISLGGIAVPVLAGVDDRVKSMVILLGGGGMGDIIWNGFATRLFKERLEEEGIRSAEELDKKVRLIDPLTFADRIKGRPVMMINANFDTSIPHANTLKLWKALDKPKLIWIPTGHFVSFFEMGYVKTKTFQFFYAEFVDRERAKDIGLPYYPDVPIQSFLISPRGLLPNRVEFDVDGYFGGGYKGGRGGIIANNLFGTNCFGGSEVFGRAAEDGRYKMEGFGGDLIYGSRLTENTHGFVKYSYETVKVHDVAEWAPEDFKRHTGRTGVSTLAFTWERNTLDDILYPVDGSYYRGSFGVASKVLGGSYNFMRAVGEGRWYISTPYPKVTFVFRGKAGWMGEYGESTDIPFFERFTLGGEDTVRGYKSCSLGPRDENNLPLWGNAMVLGNIETRFPIYRWFNGALFYDVGGNWEHLNRVKIPKDLQNSVGLGVRFRFKRFIARLDYGYPLNKNEVKREGRFHFGAGVPF
ncbi:MAG: BamA/TamA family outer membrane protein [Candidatus Omnitrophota bacterium]|jgi:dienelactone hydrolase